MKTRTALIWLAATLLMVACAGGADLPWNEDFAAVGDWQAESDAAAQVDVSEGMLRIQVAAANQLAWASAGRDLEDLHLTVEATQLAGPDDNEYGVLVRMEDAENFYRFSISGDGFFLVTKFVDGGQELIDSNWQPTEAINQGQATNTIEVICQGSELTLVVNGQELARLQDEQFDGGDIGLYAGTFSQTGVEIAFDNLQVTEP
jgi:hypothetical protein